MAMPHFIHFLVDEHFRWLPIFCYCEQCCNKHQCIRFFCININSVENIVMCCLMIGYVTRNIWLGNFVIEQYQCVIKQTWRIQPILLVCGLPQYFSAFFYCSSPLPLFPFFQPMATLSYWLAPQSPCMVTNVHDFHFTISIYIEKHWPRYEKSNPIKCSCLYLIMQLMG